MTDDPNKTQLLVDELASDFEQMSVRELEREKARLERLLIYFDRVGDEDNRQAIMYQLDEIDYELS